MKKFIIWIAVFALLLTSIPLLILLDYYLLAKILGFIVVILTTVAIRFWIAKANKSKILKGTVVLNVNDRFELEQLLPIYKTMSGIHKKNFERNVSVLLSDLSFDNFDQTNPSKKSILAFASIASFIYENDIARSSKRKVVVFSELQELNTDERNGILHFFIDSIWCEKECLKIKNAENIPISETTLKIFKSFIVA
jgi:hypothetical protein